MKKNEVGVMIGEEALDIMHDAERGVIDRMTYCGTLDRRVGESAKADSWLSWQMAVNTLNLIR